MKYQPPYSTITVNDLNGTCMVKFSTHSALMCEIRLLDGEWVNDPNRWMHEAMDFAVATLCFLEIDQCYPLDKTIHVNYMGNRRFVVHDTMEED